MKLNQIIAIEKNSREKAKKFLTEIYHKFQKTELFSGFNKKFSPLDENGERLEDETKKVDCKVNYLFEELVYVLVKAYDETLTKDKGNCIAFTDLIVNDETIAEKVPVTFLIYLEKQLVDLRTLINEIPVLSPSENWVYDAPTGLFKSEITTTHRYKKVPEVIVKYEATDKHPAQTELISIDKIIGHWSTQKMSGASEPDKKKKLLKRLEELIEAVKMAREECNTTFIEKQKIGASIFNYLLK
jgi:hypothetical protein